MWQKFNLKTKYKEWRKRVEMNKGRMFVYEAHFIKERTLEDIAMEVEERSWVCMDDFDRGATIALRDLETRYQRK